MYAVIRSGGKQYKVAPGDILRLEKLSADQGTVELPVLAVSGENGLDVAPAQASVKAEVLTHDRGAKVLVFKYKRKKQYKKLIGHRQSFTQVRIASIQVGDKEYAAQ